MGSLSRFRSLLRRQFARLRRSLTIEWKIGMATVAVVSVLLAVLAGAYLNASHLQETSGDTRAAQEVIDNLHLMFADVQDIESGSRGFVITGDDRQLVPYLNGRAHLAVASDQFRRSAAGDPWLLSHFEDVEPLFGARVDFAARVVQLRRESGLAPARDLIASGAGQSLTDEIRARLSEIETYAYQHLESDRQVESRNSRWVFLTTIAALVITFALLVGVYVVVHNEISFRRRAERTLQLTEQQVRDARARLAAIIGSATDAILTLDEAGNVVMYNDAAEAMLGVPVYEIIGQSAMRFVPQRFRSGDGGIARDFVLAAAVERATAAYDIRVLRADGSEFPAEAHVSVAETGGQRLYTLIFRDVTSRKTAEDALRRSEANYRAVVEGSSDAIFVHDIDASGESRCVFANASYEAVYGMPPSAVVGKTLAEVFPPATAAFVEDRHAAAIASREPLTYERTFDVNGEERAIVVHLTPIFDDAGRCYRIIGSTRDITDQRRARRLEQDARHVRSLGVLAGGVAHDFNNLLTAILGNAGLAGILLEPASPAREPVTEIEAAARHAAELVTQLLAYSGQGDTHTAMVEIGTLVDSTVEQLRSSIAVPITVRHDPAGLSAIEADAAQLRQALSNVIYNAAEAVAGGPGTITVSTGTRFADRAYLAGAHAAAGMPEAAYTFIDVKDTGPGMDAETCARAFEPFFTTRFTGRGLGLAAALGIVRGHGGAIRIDSVPGHGTLVSLLLPCAAAQPGATTAAPLASSGRQPRIHGERSAREGTAPHR